MNYQREKQIVRSYYAELDDVKNHTASHVLKKYTGENYTWRGYYPFDNLKTAEDVATQFWQPLQSSLTSTQRRMDVFFAGKNQIDGFQSVWVVSMGHMMGLFDKEWLGIQPTGKMAFLRYCEFHKVENGKITETSMYFDIPHFMAQAGYILFPDATAAQLIQPGPMTHDGLLFDEQPSSEGQATLQSINQMIADLGQWQNALPLEDELRQSWHEDMIWWGPTGIGASYTIERYATQHSRPFRTAFSERSGTGHIARLAEGRYGAFFGWPNFKARLSGPFMGMEPTHEMGEFRVIDVYRRSGDKLAENWIFIDMLHFWKQQGRDFLHETTGFTSL
jgi:predicted ester cyclase